ncbi:MAG: hypothetical protein KAJ18_11480 [Candidatus Omnitrophica bacterium]|nr:hypothetical protein [Candidatus Omnitrophota bacterium]
MGKRGQKECPECQEINGVRSYNCKGCDYEFPMKKRRKGKRRIPVENWRALKAGDKVRVVGGSGSYYVDPNNKEKIYMSERGTYTIFGKDDQGLKTYGDGGYAYLYMGKKKKSIMVDNLYRSPHKLLLIK